MTADRGTDAEWITAVARPNTPLFLSFLISGQERAKIEEHTGLPVGFTHIRRRGIRLQYRADEIAAAKQAITELRERRGLALFEDYAQRCLSSCAAFLRRAKQLGIVADGAAATGASREERVDSYFSSAIAHATFLQTMILMQFELETFLDEFVADHTAGESEGERRRIADALKLALEPNHEIVNVTELLELGRFVQETVPGHAEWVTVDPADLIVRIASEFPELWERIRSYAERFGWMGRSYYVGSPTTSADVVLRLCDVLKDDCTERLRRAATNRERQLAERERAIAALGATAQAEHLAAVMSTYMHLRTYRLDVFFMAHELMVEVFREVARQLGLSGYEDTAFLAWQDITAALAGRSETVELTEKIVGRRGGFEFRATAGATEWLPTIPSAPSPAKRATDGATDTLHGVTGCPGQYTGRVRIIANAEDVRAMEPGEVLVTTMTLPSRMAAVEKARAIVTDEGGMLSHAVLVSREFNIPCVIGTGDATERLRTGDIIEVDASAATVRVVSAAAPDE
jgi:phosphohistidine swiveling domain-containing protein